MNKQKLFLPVLLWSLFITLLISLRFWRLSEIPTAYVHDELIYLIQARALAFTGSNMSGSWQPFSLTPFNGAFAELPSVFLTLTVPWFSDPMFGGRILHALMGLSIPILLGLFVHGIWRNRQLSLITALLAIVNPWLWQYSRMAFDSLFSLFFYLSAAVVLFHFKSWWKLFCIPLLILGFYQYQGLKLVFLPYVIGCIVLFLLIDGVRFSKWKYTAKHSSSVWIAVIVLISSIALFSIYLLHALPNQQASVRLSQVRIPSNELVINAVNKERRLSLISPLTYIVVNKYVETVRGSTDALFKVFDLSFLFIFADEVANSFAVTKYGYFYLIDLLLLFIGFYWLIKAKKDRMVNFTYVILLVSATIPALLSFGQSFSFRASLFYLFLIPVIAHGVYFIVTLNRQIYTSALGVLYFLFVCTFLAHYYYQYPVYAADSHFFSERVLASYLARIPNYLQVYIVVPDQEFMFNSYLYYNNLYTKNSANVIKNAVNEKTFTYKNVHVVTDCLYVPIDEEPVIITARTMDDCLLPPVATESAILTVDKPRIVSVPAIVDSGELYRISNDPVCAHSSLARFIMPQRLSSFRVEKLETDQFCQEWFTDVTN